ncbi:MAG: polyprenyl synthetase family protein [Oscillospiraceae bacterium]|jgi:geranylgeranyl diphosphate synthase type II|nr:polyprenyl synthetase family protein [Oscillospiraceae bacterium]
MNFKEKYAEYKQITEEALTFAGNRGSPLREVVRYSLEAGGKRVRPVLVLAFCEACGGDISKAAPLAAAIEMLHTSTLIQDDLPCMDDDDLRRGKPACHKAFSEADAVLAASAMAYNAIGMIDNLRIVKEICRYMSAVYDGQKLDLMYESQAATTAEEILDMYGLKTCALLKASCTAGCLAADADGNIIKNAADYAYNLGLAFQLIDDILDGEGGETAGENAEKYTRKALELLENVPNNNFLKELTKNLLNRKN